MLNYITFSTAFEIQCFLVAIFCLSRDMELPWRIIPIYLLITCIVEFIGIYLKREHQPNQWPYNILLVCHIVFTSFMFSSLLSKYKNNRPPIIGGLVVLILFYAYDLFQHGFLRFNILCYNSMSVFFTVYSLFIFIYYYKKIPISGSSIRLIFGGFAAFCFLFWQHGHQFVSRKISRHHDYAQARHNVLYLYCS